MTPPESLSALPRRCWRCWCRSAPAAPPMPRRSPHYDAGPGQELAGVHFHPGGCAQQGAVHALPGALDSPRGSRRPGGWRSRSRSTRSIPATRSATTRCADSDLFAVKKFPQAHFLADADREDRERLRGDRQAHHPRRDARGARAIHLPHGHRGRRHVRLHGRQDRDASASTTASARVTGRPPTRSGTRSAYRSRCA